MDAIVFQPVYMYFNGHGSTEYLCAPSAKAAREFVAVERQLSRLSSLYASNVYMRSGGTFWLRGGIGMSNPTDSGDLIKDIKPKE